MKDEVSKDRNEIQKEITEASIASLNASGKAGVIASVGIGKSKITLDILSSINPDKITWITSNEQLRDVDSPNEFYKWGFEHLLDKTTFVCYQTAYKWEDVDMGFVVYDEGDVLLTEEYIKSHINNNQDKVLWVSGTITQDKRRILKDTLEIPVVYEISNQQSQDLGVLNKTNFVFVEYELSLEKTYKKVTKTKSWMTSENEEYNYIESKYMKVLLPFLAIQKKMDNHFNKGIPFPNGETYSSLKEQKIRLIKSMQWINNERYRFLQGLNTNLQVTKGILKEHYYGNDKDKMVVFAGLTSQIEKVCKHTYHSKNKKGSTVIDDFNSDKIRVMGVCSALDRGKNMVGLNIGVWSDFNSSHTKLGQQIGRFCRLAADQEATLYFLIPFYKKRVWNKEESRYEYRRTPTRASAWLESALINYRLDSTNSKTIKV
jgi:superfamily II DNA or RNA helicase